MNHKKFLSLLLAICMVLAMLPTVALAEGTTAVDVLNREFTGRTGTSYGDWTGTGESGAVYAGQSAGGNNSIQLRSKNNNSGIVTTVSGGKAVKIAVKWNSNTSSDATLDIYGKSSAYSATTDLYSNSTQGTKLGSIVCGTSTELTISGDYEYIGMRSNSGAMWLEEIDITWTTDGEVPPVTTYTVSFDANGGTGTMANVTTASPYTLPTCGFTAPEGKEFEGWKIDGGDDTLLAVGTAVELTADTTFVAQWKDLPVVTYTNMKLKRVPANGDTVVIYYPKASKVMTGESFYYNKKYELVAADATLTDNVLAVPDEAVRLTVSVADGKYTFATADGKYLEADGTNVQLVSAQSANTLFQLETAAAGTDNYYIKCDSATYNSKAQYIEYYGGGYFTVYSLNTSNTPIFTFQFFSEDGEGPTPETTYTVTLNPGDAEGEPQTIEDVTSPYTLPDCPFTAPEGKKFTGWKMAGDDRLYAAGDAVVISADTAFTAQWKELVLKTYTLITSEDQLTAGDTVIVVGLNEDKAYALAQQWTNNRRAAEIMLEGNKAFVDVDLIATEAVDEPLVYELTLGGNADSGWSFFDPLNKGYLYAAGSGNNMKTQETNDDRGMFTLTFDDGGAIVAVSKGEETNKYFRFNTNGIFSCYKESSTVKNPIYLYKYAEEEEPTKPTFQDQSLILDGKIGLSFNMELPEIAGVDYDTSYMTFGVEHGTCTERVDYSAAKLRKSGTKAFVCYVTAIMMAEPITATFHYTQDGTEKTVEKTYAITEYFDAFDATLQDDPNAYDQKTITLVHALADYGHYVQTYLADAKGWTLGTDYAKMDKVYTETYTVSDIAAAVENKGIACENSDDNISRLTFALVLDSATEIRLLFKTQNTYTGSLSATVDGASFAVTEVDSKKAVQIVNIPAHQLSKSYAIVISTDNGQLTINVSVLSYVKVLIASSQATMQNAACAIYCYSAAADAYKAGN